MSAQSQPVTATADAATPTAQPSAAEWRPTSEAVEQAGVYIDVRSVTTYRWLPYKPDGARQMKKKGRWQRATEHGWTNDELPEGEWIPNLPQPKATGEA